MRKERRHSREVNKKNEKAHLHEIHLEYSMALAA